MDVKWIFLVFVAGVLSEEANDDSQPSLRIIPKSAIIDLGQKRAIYCEGTNLPDAQAFQWLTPSGTVLAAKSNKNTRVYLEKSKLRGNPNTLMAALVISTASREDSGNWTCKAGELEDTIEVYVGVKMNLANEPLQSSIQEDEGKFVQMDCFGKGEPVPSAQWYKDGTPLITDTRRIKIIHTKDHNTKLEIRNLNHMDSGLYVCKLTQKLFMTFAERKIILYVKHKPILMDREGNEITASVQEDYAILDEKKVLNCSSKAYPPAKYTWYMRKNGNFDERIPEDESDSKEPSSPRSAKSHPTGQYSELILLIRNESYLGQYKCEAKNDHGMKTVIFDVTLGEKPPAPSTISLESANYTELIFNVTCSNCTFKSDEESNSRLTVNEYHFQFVEFKEGFLPDWESDSKQDIEVKIEERNDTLFIVGPLPNGTKLSVRVRSRNQAGYSDWLDTSLVVETSKALKLAATFVLILIAYFFVSN